MADGRRLSRGGAVLMGAVFMASGAVLLAVAAGLLPLDPQALEAPRWVIASAGAMFLAGGMVPLGVSFQFPAWLNQGTGLVAASGLAAVFNWIAFFPGPRHFRTSTSVLGTRLGYGPGDDLTGRVLFGIAAVLIDVIWLLGLWRLVRLLHGRQNREP